MPYTAEISVSHNTPACFLFLIDQSGSMRDPWGVDNKKPKCEAVATIINRLLDNLVIRCCKNEGVMDYFHVGVIGYGPGNTAQFAWIGNLSNEKLVPVSKLRDNAQITEVKKKVDAGDGTLIERTVKMSKWFDPVGKDGTPMEQAFKLAQGTLQDWIAEHPNSFPPIVFNITDGQPNAPAQAETEARLLTHMATLDGNVLLFNLHISEKTGQEIIFPDSENNLPDDFAKRLFRMSSILPEPFRKLAAKEEIAMAENGRGFLFNAESVNLIQFLDIGTRVQELR